MSSSKPVKIAVAVLGLWMICPWGTGRSGGEIVIKATATKTKSTPQPGIVVPPPGETNGETQEDRVEFLNGDKLHGTFISMDRRNGARWQHPAIRQPMTIQPNNLAKISLNRPATTNSHPEETCGVKLTNDDELVGQLVGMDEKTLTLKTWYAGVLEIPRNLVGSLSPGRAPASAVYEGPTGLEGWRVSSRVGGALRAGEDNQSWRFAGGAFVSGGSGSIGRDVGLPPKSNIEFEIARRGYLQLSVCFYATSLDRYGGDSLMLQFSHSAVYLQRMAQNGNSSSLGQAQVLSLGKNMKSHISIRSDREQKTISLLVDGTMAKQWTDRGTFPAGGGLLFVHQGQGILKLSNLRVSEWDGRFENAEADAEKSEEDFVRLANKDKITGSLKAIKEGKMSFATAFATLDVPLERRAAHGWGE